MNDFNRWNPPVDAPVDVESVSEDFSPVSEPQQPRQPRIVPLLLVTALVAGASGGFAGYVMRDGGTNNIVLTQSGGDSSERPAGSIAAIAAAVKDSVVSISVQSAMSAGTGSGWIVDSRGYIVTNNHVIADAANGGSITVSFADGQSVAAKIVGRNSAYDLAVIKVDVSGLKALPLGNSNNIVVGDSVVAIGSPLGLQGTVTSGIISAMDRPVTAGGSGELAYFNGLQTDAAINPGNSGGPLVNAAGEVIGVNSAIATMGGSMGGQSGSIGLGFAIPINTAKRIVQEIINTGTSTMPIIGVQLDLNSTQDGALIADVHAGGPASKAGIGNGTLITAIDGVKVHDSVGLIVRIRAKAPGEVVTLTSESGSTFSVTLGSQTLSS
ncbi:MAG: hypothetical protein RIS43_161 [Actinomycetota bacterium]